MNFGKKAPTPQAVAYRAICLHALLQRTALEDELRKLREEERQHPFFGLKDLIEESVKIIEEDGTDISGEFDGLEQVKQQADNIFESDITLHRKELTESADNLKSWLDSSGIFPHFSVKEKMLIVSIPGSWSDKKINEYSWRSEALGVLLWALEIEESILSCDTRFDNPESLDKIPLMTDPSDFIANAKLRDRRLIGREKFTAGMWHWRAGAAKMQREAQAKLPAGTDLSQIIKTTAERAFAMKNIPHLIDGDFPAKGKPYRELDDEETAILGAIAAERFFALGWLWGENADWDNKFM